MKRFQFQLESLLKLRTQMVRIAEAKKMRLLAQLAEHRQQLIALDDEKDHGVDVRSAAAITRTGNTIALWLDNIRRRQAAVRGDMQAIEAELLVVNDELRNLETDAEALDTLRRGELVDYRKAVERARQHDRDETILRSWDVGVPADHVQHE